MKRSIIYSKEYRNHHFHFMRYLLAIGYSVASCKTFATGTREFLCWLEQQQILSVHHVQASDIENFHSHQQQRLSTRTGETLSGNRIYNQMYVVKLFFCYLQDVEQLESSPVSELDYPEPEKRTRENLLSREDIEKLYEECEAPKQRAMLGLLYGCGLRRQEAVKLNVSDVHFKSCTLYVREGKGGSKRAVPLSRTVLTDLRDYYYYCRPNELCYNCPDSAEAFMLNTRGKRMQGDSYWLEMKKLIIKAELNEAISLHHFRHAIATHLLENGLTAELVKCFLGHKSIETTQTYTHITTEQIKKTTAYGAAAVPV
jgi:integrase/recombinase XerD